MENLLVFESNSRVIMFEPKNELPNGFFEAKKWLNTIALETGSFSEYIFNKGLCRKPSAEEVNYYTSLKDRSVYALNAD